MENEIAKQQRDIEVVTEEIKDLCREAQRTMLLYAVEIGRRLVEAKEILPHGEWGEWLKNEVSFSQSTANKHMQLFEAYGNRQTSLFGAELNSETFTNLSYSQALKLLAVPEEEREDFVKDNDIANKSTRDIDKLIKERDEALKTAEAAEQYKQEIEELQSKLEKSQTAAKKAKADLKALKENPEIPESMKNDMRTELEAEASANKQREIDEAIADTADKLKSAEAENESLKAEIENKRARLEELENKNKMSDPVIVEFNLLFNDIQETADKLLSIISACENEETREKLKKAFDTLIAGYTIERLAELEDAEKK